jgi:hypothetical protein
MALKEKLTQEGTIRIALLRDQLEVMDKLKSISVPSYTPRAIPTPKSQPVY